MNKNYDFGTVLRCCCAFQRFVDENKNDNNKMMDFIEDVFGSNVASQIYYQLESQMFDVAEFYFNLGETYQGFFCSNMQYVEV